MSEVTHPEVSWNSALEELLCQEAEKCSGLSWLHNKSELLYSKWNTALQLPIIIISAVSGFLSGVLPPSSEAQYTVGSISVLVAVLGSVNSFFSYAKRSEGHRVASIQYSQVSRDIRIEMNLPAEQRVPPNTLLKWIKEDLKRLSETSPQLPEVIIELYKKEIVPHSKDVSHPEVTNGIACVTPYSVDELPPLPSAVSQVKIDSPSGVKIGLEV